MANVTAPQFQQDVNNAADWANGDENTTVTMRLGQQADSPAKVIKRVDDLAAAQREDIYENATPYTVGNFTDGFTYTALNQRGEFGGDQYVFLGGLDGLPHVVAPATDPTLSPALYAKANYNDAASVANASGGNVQNQLDIKDGLTVSEAINYAGIASLLGSRVWLTDRNAWFDIVLSSSFSGDGGGIDELTSVSNPSYGFKLEDEAVIYLDKLGAGTSDDANIINRAQDLANGKPIIYDASKTYTASQITIKGRSFHLSSNFFSAENGTYTKPRLKRADATNVDFFKYESLNDEPFFMVGLQLDGNKSNNTDGSGLVISNQRSMIKECGIHNFNKDGITIEDNGSALVEIRIQNNMISYNGRDGIRNNGTNSTDHHIVENEIFRNDGRGIYSLFNTFNWAVRLNHLYANGLESIRAEDCIRTKIQNNKSDNVGRLATYNISGIYISTNNGFTGNQIQNNESSGGKFISSTPYNFTGIECNVVGSALNQVSNNTIVGMIDPNLTTFYPSRSTALKITGAGVMQGSVYDNDVLQCDTVEDFNSEFTLSYNNRLVQNSGSTSANQRKPTSNFESFTYNKGRTNGTKRLIEYGDYTAPPSTGSWDRNDIVYYKEPVRGGKIGAICYSSGSPGSWGEFGQVGYRESAFTPSGSVTPRFIGEEYFKNDTGDWFKSTGLTNTDWKQIT